MAKGFYAQHDGSTRNDALLRTLQQHDKPHSSLLLITKLGS